MDHKVLYQRSVDIIIRNQHPSGSFIASPNFEKYKYSWLRDGSYIAHAMNVVGRKDSSAAFHGWVDQAIKRYRHKIKDLHKALVSGQTPQDTDFLFTRYSLEGFEDLSDDSWGNNQYDGYGTWLWALREHYRMNGESDLIYNVWHSVRDVVDYLMLVWRLPSYDSWEEHPELLHPYSMACVYGGLQAALDLARDCGLTLDSSAVETEAEKIRQFILDNAVCENVLVKHIHPDPEQNPYCHSSVDANLLSLVRPYGLVAADSQIAKATLSKIRQELLSESGGIHRYGKDTYYGGGTWILLTAWLGWVEAEIGDLESAQKRLDWIATQVDDNDWLPEQILDEVLYPEMITPWMKQWGKVATPLLWSHAMYLILFETLKNKKNGG
jgi:GH15 family glucan-1,4-alpha-glucosidase